MESLASKFFVALFLMGFSVNLNHGVLVTLPICSPLFDALVPTGYGTLCQYLCSLNGDNIGGDAYRYTESCCGEGDDTPDIKKQRKGAKGDDDGGDENGDYVCYCCAQDAYDCESEKYDYFYEDCYAVGLCTDRKKLTIKNKTLSGNIKKKRHIQVANLANKEN